MSTITAWIAIILTFLLNLVLVRRVNDAVHGNSGRIELDPHWKTTDQTDFLPRGMIAPSFTAHRLDGIEVTSENYRGKIAVFTFVTNDPPSHRFLQNLDEGILSEISDLDLNFTLAGVVSLQDTQGLLDKTNAPFPSLVALRTTNPFSIEYKVWSTPLSYVLDEEGKIKWAGNVSAQTIGELLKEWVA